ncbi:MAG: hypothetical protein HY361_03700 [Candidatus Aenigmarchaeota archaeon]|nr:hypothetical protein [Candidatus Aenigmarchaeota archaeon]
MKAIAVHTIFILITTVIFLFFAIIIIFGFLNIAGLEASQTTCTIKLLNYCTSWLAKGYADKPYKWADKDPKDCSQFLKDIGSDGPTKDQCEPIVK